MIRANIAASTLEEYYTKLVAAQQAAHGENYCSHHAVICEKAKECVSYCELGTNQGATLACAVLAGYGILTGVDLSLEPWRPAEALFRQALTHHLQLTMLEQDSRRPVGSMDFLLIDSRHEPDHLRAELATHGPHVRRWILLHDTFTVPALHAEAERWAKANHWTVEQRNCRSVGFTLLRKLP